MNELVHRFKWFIKMIRHDERFGLRFDSRSAPSKASKSLLKMKPGNPGYYDNKKKKQLGKNTLNFLKASNECEVCVPAYCDHVSENNYLRYVGHVVREGGE